MGMSLHDAQLFYDGPIPPGAIDPSAPDRFRSEAPPIMARVVFKPEVIRRRMARVIGTLGVRGTITKDDLLQQGFTETELKEHFQDALREALQADDTMLSIEAVA